MELHKISKENWQWRGEGNVEEEGEGKREGEDHEGTGWLKWGNN